MRMLLPIMSLLVVGMVASRTQPVLLRTMSELDDMDDILKVAGSHRRQCALDAIAHQLSAEAHRSRSMRLGGASEGLSTIVGSAVFASLITFYGIGKEITLPTTALSVVGFGAVLTISIAGPVLAAIRRILHDAEDFTSHLASTSVYMLIWMRLDVFILRYHGSQQLSNARSAALDDLSSILAEYGALPGKSITITRRAYADAEAELRNRGFDFALEDTVREPSRS